MLTFPDLNSIAPPFKLFHTYTAARLAILSEEFWIHYLYRISCNYLIGSLLVQTTYKSFPPGHRAIAMHILFFIYIFFVVTLQIWFVVLILSHLILESLNHLHRVHRITNKRKRGGEGGRKVRRGVGLKTMPS
jgi:hypothetical protein